MFKKQTERQPGGGRDHEPATKTPLGLTRAEWRRLKIGWSVVAVLIFVCAVCVGVFGWAGLGYAALGIVAILAILFIVFILSMLFIVGPDEW